MKPIMKQRIEWVDTAKAIGMFLVFYGHYIEKVSQIEGETGIAMMQLKFIYSFTMPLFLFYQDFLPESIRINSGKLKSYFFSLSYRFSPLVSYFFHYGYCLINTDSGTFYLVKW